ncbi:response regulator [Methylobacterium sp. A54F]
MPEAATAPPLAADRIGILLVEDEPMLLLSTALAFEEAGITVFEASNSDEAVKVLSQRDDIRVLITDVAMPRGAMNGYQLARLVASRWPHMGVLILSGVDRPAEGDMPPGVRFMPKPYRTRDLIGQVFAFVSRQSGSV